MGACFDEVSCFEGPRSVLRHDELGEEIENGVFDALPQGEAPPLVEAICDRDNLLVEIIRPVDDGQRVH